MLLLISGLPILCITHSLIHVKCHYCGNVICVTIIHVVVHSILKPGATRQRAEHW